MEDEQNGSYQHGRQPKSSKSIKQGLQCGKRNSENGSVVSSLARFFIYILLVFQLFALSAFFVSLVLQFILGVCFWRSFDSLILLL